MKPSLPRAGWIGLAFAWLTVTLLVLWITGVVMMEWPASELMDMSDAEAMLRRVSGIVHGVMTWVLCVVLGRGVWPHVLLMIRQRADRWQWNWGWINLAVLGVLAVSGVVLLYGSAAWHDATASVHAWLGIVSVLPYVLHTWRRWASRTPR